MSAVQAPTKTLPRSKAPNLSTVTPDRPPPPVNDGFDTKTPMDVSVLPFNQLILAKWTPWLLCRMEEFWPILNSWNFSSRLLPFMGPSGSLFIRAKNAILLAVMTREDLEPRPIVDVVFCFRFEPENEEHVKDMRLLFRRADEWAKTLGARYVRIQHPERIDLQPKKVEEILWGEPTTVLVKDLDK